MSAAVEPTHLARHGRTSCRFSFSLGRRHMSTHGLLLTRSSTHGRFTHLSCYSMFPLLFELQEYPIKVLLLATYSVLIWVGFSSHFSNSNAPKPAKAKRVERSGNESGLIGPVAACYLLGLVGVEIWGQFLHPYVFGCRFPFLPLMLISAYCAIGMMYSWAWQLKQIIMNT